MTAQQIAKVCHDTNRAYCQTLGDETQPPWESAPEWQRASALNGVRFHLNNPGSPPSRSHELWLEEKYRTGWKYGPVKNPETKEHPCMVPFEGLPPEQQAKDRLFASVVDALRHLCAEPEPLTAPA